MTCASWRRLLGVALILLPVSVSGARATAAEAGNAGRLQSAARWAPQSVAREPARATPPIVLPEPAASSGPPSFGALDHSIVYDNGRQMILSPAGGTGVVGLVSLSNSPYPFKRPRYAGWQFIYYDRAFYLGDILGHHTPIAAPVQSGEQVYDAWPSPDGRYIAWVLVSAGPWDGATFSMGASRIVITDQSGGNARVLVQQTIDGAGGVPIIYGWRYGQPPTLLVQNSYGFAGLHRGLQEFNPVVGDLVGDWLPPTGESTQPAGEVLDLSPSGQSITYATTDTPLPSGEGPFPANLYVMALDGRRVSLIDTASTHKDKATSKQPAPSAYVFSRQAFISPDDTRVAYTRLDVIYPKSALAPLIRPIACIANVDGSGKSDLAAGYSVAGWIDATTVLLDKSDAPNAGLYSLDLGSGRKTLIVKGSNLRVDGIVP